VTAREAADYGESQHERMRTDASHDHYHADGAIASATYRFMPRREFVARGLAKDGAFAIPIGR